LFVALSGQEASAAVEVPVPPVGLEELLQGLTVLEQQVMLSKYRDGLKVRAIAERLGKTENAVKLILSRTRRKLKKSLV
jgi:RNA polymerase sigma-70 factor (ECF subfamily)